MNENTSLMLLSRASQALVEADTVVRLKELKNLALTAADWLKRKNAGDEIIQKAKALAFDAERKMGEMLLTKPPKRGAGPGRGKQGVSQAPCLSDVPSLKELGITTKESSVAKKLASLPEDTFVAVKSGVTTVTQVQREIREKKREEKRRANRKKAEESKSIKELVGIFTTILIDPPWDWSDEGDVNQLGRAKPDYATMTLGQLLEIPVKDWADKDCHLYCWSTNRSLPKVYSLFDVWGFRYITLLTWPKPSFGMGNYFRGQTEHIAFGVKGSQLLKRKDASTLLPTWDRGEHHSSKPLEIYEFIESCSPGPYLEIFGRNKRDGWTIIGEGGING